MSKIPQHPSSYLQELECAAAAAAAPEPRQGAAQLPDQHRDALQQVRQEEGGQEVPRARPERHVHPQQGDGNRQVRGTHRLRHRHLGRAGDEETYW